MYDQPHPTISVIAVTWNGKAYAREFLDSVQAYGPPGLEVIVVDNNSSDGTAELIAQEYTGVKLIRNGANVGFAKATNMGIQASAGKYVCLINSDVVLSRRCLEQLVQFLEMPANRDVGLLGPQMLGVGGQIRRSTMRFPTLSNTVCRALAVDRIPSVSRICKGQLMYGFEHNATSEVEVLNGWFWVVRREALDAVGVLDERFFIYGEDIDWCFRFRQKGWRVLFYAGAKAVHYGGASSSVAPERFYVEMQRADLQYWRKHHTIMAYRVYYGVVCVHHCLRMLGHYALAVLRCDTRRRQALKGRRSWAALSFLFGLRRMAR